MSSISKYPRQDGSLVEKQKNQIEKSPQKKSTTNSRTRNTTPKSLQKTNAKKKRDILQKSQSSKIKVIRTKVPRRKFVRKQDKGFAKNTNTTRYMLKLFFKCYHKYWTGIKERFYIKKSMTSKVKRYLRALPDQKKFEGLSLLHFKKFFEEQQDCELNSCARKLLANVLIQESRMIAFSRKIISKKQYMMTMKVHAIRARCPKLISRVQLPL